MTGDGSVGRFAVGGACWMCQSLTSDLCCQTNLTLSEPRPFSSFSPSLFSSSSSLPPPPVLVLFISTERNKLTVKHFYLFFLLFCKLLSCHIVIGINLCVSVLFFLPSCFYWTCFSRFVHIYIKSIWSSWTVWKAWRRRRRSHWKPKIPLGVFFFFLSFFSLVSCLLWGSGFRPGVWRGLRPLLVLVRWFLFCFYLPRIFQSDLH